MLHLLIFLEHKNEEQKIRFYLDDLCLRYFRLANIEVHNYYKQHTILKEFLSRNLKNQFHFQVEFFLLLQEKEGRIMDLQKTILLLEAPKKEVENFDQKPIEKKKKWWLF